VFDPLVPVVQVAHLDTPLLPSFDLTGVEGPTLAVPGQIEHNAFTVLVALFDPHTPLFAVQRPVLLPELLDGHIRRQRNSFRIRLG